MHLAARLQIALSPALSLNERQRWLEGVILAGLDSDEPKDSPIMTKAQSALDELEAYRSLGPIEQQQHQLHRERTINWKNSKENN